MNKNIRRATKIMLIRHAEKPLRSAPNHGVMASGKHNPESLIVQGWQRAGALANIFAPPHESFQHLLLGRPEFLYSSKPVTRHGSRRSFETILPLSEKLGIEINSEFSKLEAEEMIIDALSCDGIVLICWPHESLPKIANYILSDNTTAPQKWPADRYDMVWVFDKDSESGRYSFKQVPQNLLKGDSSAPIK